jgi:hypothetical protein
MSAAPSAIPPNPKTAAISAITRKIIIQRTIMFSVLLISNSTKIHQEMQLPYMFVVSLTANVKGLISKQSL